MTYSFFHINLFYATTTISIQKPTEKQIVISYFHRGTLVGVYGTIGNRCENILFYSVYANISCCIEINIHVNCDHEP